MRQEQTDNSGALLLSVHDLFNPPAPTEVRRSVDATRFSRRHFDLSGKAAMVLDEFPDAPGTSCCFIRTLARETRSVRFLAPGVNRIESSPSGGWILMPTDTTLPTYWIPQPALARTLDSQLRILSESTVSIADIAVSSGELVVAVEIPKDNHLDWTIWRFPPEQAGLSAELARPLGLETQQFELWSSTTAYQAPADLYQHLVNGHVYVNCFIWSKKWKMCCELDAYGLYTIMCGLELATEKQIYSLLKRQILFSVIERQAADGGWYHGEWTDRMESHYRYHNGGMLLLEAALKEHPDEVVRKALEKAAHFIAQCTDRTALGLWFLHDSLEYDAESMDALCSQTGSTWVPARTLGKSPTNKLILNTHVDTVVTLQQYRDVTGDRQYAEQISSARAAVRNVLALRPAELLYRLLYRAIRLTLLPTREAERLPLTVRAVKRLTWKYLIPLLHSRIKRIFPRIVMPGGLIERHLAMPHYDINYHTVNILDLTRLWRCFPDENLGELLAEAVTAVSDTSMLKYWADWRPRHFSLVVWVDALYHLCTLRQDARYRHLLAEGIIILRDTGLGLPPSLLGADFEAVAIGAGFPCPSPADRHLLVANLGNNRRREVLVVNSSDTDREVIWQGDRKLSLSWARADGQPVPAGSTSLRVKSRSWIWGRNL
jgi:hypothetical protein